MACNKCGVDVIARGASQAEALAHQQNCSGVFGYKYIYRFVGSSEMKTLYGMRKNIAKDNEISELSSVPSQDIRAFYGRRLSENMTYIRAQPGFANLLQAHTMSRYGGGQIGSAQRLVSFVTDPERLRQSTDTSVQNICANAEYIIKILAPNDACLPGASPLSQSETEVVVCNDIAALSMLLAEIRMNPYRT